MKKLIEKFIDLGSPLVQGALAGIGISFAAVPLIKLLGWWVDFWFR